MCRGDSVVDFARFMMGCIAGDFPLPPEPTIEEIRSRENFALAYRAIHPAHSSTVQPSIPMPDYYQSGLLTHPKFALSDKNRCDLEFISKGFTRITFEWSNPNLTDSAWNSGTADIICGNWVVWALENRKTSTCSVPDAKKELQEWLLGTRANLAQIRNQMKEGQDFGDGQLEMKKDELEVYRKKMAESRFRTGLLIFPNNPDLLALFQDPDAVSDYKDVDDITVLPTRIIPSWRSDVLTQVVRAIDVATVQLAAREKKMSIMRWLTRGSERRVTHGEEYVERIPIGLPFDAYNTDFLEKTSTLEHHQLRIGKRDKVKSSLHTALEHLEEITKKSSRGLAD
ncbi:hypothetical protein PGT21_000964 [Puccinia graminis f. sp. tritici]|uniref:Uncharacterized protein n=1 Tax=Puccinia graminis f. sp. tritici TaxID=56615 RepID=A0A5B0P710_PUCGR|nr:hypothetical protein PGT21_000964 [Puccinia graminis f. sp. tritici]KAA1134384.1 hypothetical protein PGTUg99_036084 [Puccinia graminis f. sp. tritici]